jgi:hypothetical protein
VVIWGSFFFSFGILFCGAFLVLNLGFLFVGV